MSVVKLLLGLGMSTIGLVYRMVCSFCTIVFMLLAIKQVLEKNSILNNLL